MMIHLLDFFGKRDSIINYININSNVNIFFIKVYPYIQQKNPSIDNCLILSIQGFFKYMHLVAYVFNSFSFQIHPVVRRI